VAHVFVEGFDEFEVGDAGFEVEIDMVVVHGGRSLALMSVLVRHDALLIEARRQGKRFFFWKKRSKKTLSMLAAGAGGSWRDRGWGRAKPSIHRCGWDGAGIGD
jgi:hypothetical protein